MQLSVEASMCAFLSHPFFRQPGKVAYLQAGTGRAEDVRTQWRSKSSGKSLIPIATSKD